MPHPRLSRIRNGIKNRCYNPKNKAYKHYGARGIKMCDEWLNEIDGHDNFVRWALDNGYKEGLTIERINVDGDYCPDNCKWATWSEQTFNRRTARSNSGERGIRHIVERDRYSARIGKGYKRVSLGEFATLEEAVKARREAEIKYFGRGIGT